MKNKNWIVYVTQFFRNLEFSSAMFNSSLSLLYSTFPQTNSVSNYKTDKAGY